MATVEHLTQQLDNLGDLASVVHTMKSLSVVSIRQYEQAVEALADYYTTVALALQGLLHDHAGGHDPEPHPRAGSGMQRHMAVVFGSDHGLCGRVNEDLADCVRSHCQATGVNDSLLLLVIGEHMVARLEQWGLQSQAQYRVPGTAEQITGLVQNILVQIDAWREQLGVQWVTLFYNQPLSTTRYRSVALPLLPAHVQQLQQLEPRLWPGRVPPTMDLDRGLLLSTLLRQYFFVSVFRACAQSQASEHGSRLAAMRVAEKNLTERINEVSAQLRQARQGQVTAELLDVVSGFEVLAHRSKMAG